MYIGKDTHDKDIFYDNLTHKISNEEGILGVSYIESCHFINLSKNLF